MTFKPRPKFAPAGIMKRLKSPEVARYRAVAAIIAAAAHLHRRGQPLSRSASASHAGPSLTPAEAYSAERYAEAITSLHRRGQHDLAQALNALHQASRAAYSSSISPSPEAAP